jgi:hypothetical protein
MALKDTNLLIQAGQIPPSFRGTPAQFAAEMVRRMRIVSPSGTNFIFIGDVEPTSNQGPWLKGGTQWFVFDEETKRYVPLDISESETRWYHIGASTPTVIEPPLWLRTERDATAADPSYGDSIEWLSWNGSVWKSILVDGISGTTAQRPAAPFEYQKFFDTTITCLLWWERSTWRTVSGVPGDIKAVAFPTLTEALLRNPGWEVLGASNQSIRGRTVMQAAKDSGANPATVLTVNTDVPVRGAFETFGETDGIAIDDASPVAYPPSIALWHLVKT